jgi:hypothetical protein
MWLHVAGQAVEPVLGRLAQLLPADDTYGVLHLIQRHLRPRNDLINSDLYRRATQRNALQPHVGAYLGIQLPQVSYAPFDTEHPTDGGVSTISEFPLPIDLWLLLREYVQQPTGQIHLISIATWHRILERARIDLRNIVMYGWDEQHEAATWYPVCYSVHAEEDEDRRHLTVLWRIVRLRGYGVMDRTEYARTELPLMSIQELDASTPLTSEQQEERIYQVGGQILEDQLTEAHFCNLLEGYEALLADAHDLTYY